jgi:soluble cytochrome b562
MYGDLIRNDDLPFVDDIRSRVGAVEEELLVARLQLRRALRAQARADELPDGMEVAETVERDGSEKTAGRSEVKKKLRDYPAIINTMLGRIESLEKTRLDLLKAEKAIQAAQAAAATQTETQNLVITVRRAGAGDDGV